MERFRNLTKTQKLGGGIGAILLLCFACFSLVLIIPTPDEKIEVEPKNEPVEIVEIQSEKDNEPETTFSNSTNTPKPTATNTVQSTATSIPPTSTPTETPTQSPTETHTPTPQPALEIISNTANVRSGPGTDFAPVGVLNQGDVVDVVAKNEDESWYIVNLRDGTTGWIAASIAKPVHLGSMNQVVLAATIPPPPKPTSPPQPTKVLSTNTPVPTQPPQPTASPAPTEPPAVSPAQVIIIAVNKRDEYVDIQNVGGSDQDLSGWVLISEKGDQACGLGGVLPAGATLRIWALASDAGQGGYNCGFGSNIWNNSDPDPAALYDASGNLVDRK